LLDDYHDYYDSYLATREKNAGVDEVRSNMASRVAQKAIRLASLATVFNKEPGSSNCLVIEEAEWTWAKKFCDYEYEQVSNALGGMIGDQKMENCIVAVYAKMVSIIDDDIKNAKCKVDVRYRRAMIIPYGKLKIACAKNTNITAINDNHGNMVTGLDKAIKDMIRGKAIEQLDGDPLGGKSPITIKLLPGITEYMKGFGI
jgi:hypothetical protein